MSLNPPGCLSHVYFLQIVCQTTGRILSMAYCDVLKWQNNFSNLTASFTGLIMILYSGIKPTWLSYYMSGNLQILRLNYYILLFIEKHIDFHNHDDMDKVYTSFYVTF